MLAADAAFDALSADRGRDELIAFPAAFEASWLHDELHRARNFKPWMSKGLYTGTLMVGIDQVLFRGRAPWTLRHDHADQAEPQAQGLVAVALGGTQGGGVCAHD